MLGLNEDQMNIESNTSRHTSAIASATALLRVSALKYGRDVPSAEPCHSKWNELSLPVAMSGNNSVPCLVHCLYSPGTSSPLRIHRPRVS